MLTGNNLILFLSILFPAFGVLRNSWVFYKRMKILRYRGSYYLNTLPSYNIMMLKFWVWDINKFLK